MVSLEPLCSLATLLVLVVTQAAAAESPFQTVRGRHITIKADETPRDSLIRLAESFDSAVPQWERFWNLTPGTLKDWSVDAFVMTDETRFRDSGDLPNSLDFPFGFAMPGNVWVQAQPSDYYTRHLLLHEGVHALAIRQFGGPGPSWFAEGVAELLAVHRGSGSQLKVQTLPRTRDEVPYWGRFKLLSQRREEGRIPTIGSVLEYPPDLKSDVESYGWSWAATMLFAEYPEYRETLIDAAKKGEDRTIVFTTSFRRELQRVWPIVQARWRLMTSTLDYGFDWSVERVELAMSDPVWDGSPHSMKVAADRGWQSPGVRFASGTRLTIDAGGRCTLADAPKPWVSEPAGVTIEYASDRPIGQLLVCIVPNATRETQFLEPLVVESVDRPKKLQIDRHSWILFRVNDHLGSRRDNRGGYDIQIRM